MSVGGPGRVELKGTEFIHTVLFKKPEIPNIRFGNKVVPARQLSVSIYNNAVPKLHLSYG